MHRFLGELSYSYIITVVGAKRACTRPQIEPKGLYAGSNIRPDILLQLGSKKVTVDVTIVHPNSAGRVKEFKEAHNKPLYAADVAAKQKVDKYSAPLSDLGKAHNVEFVPFAADTYGGLARGARKFIMDTALAAKDKSSIWTVAEIRSYLVAAVAISIQRGNWAIINNAYMTNRIEIVSNRNNSNNKQSFSQLSSAASIRSAAQLFLSDVDVDINVASANIVAIAAG